MQQNKNEQSIQFCIFDFPLNEMLLFRFRVHPFILFNLEYSGSPSAGSSSLVITVMFLMIGLILLSSVTSNLTSGPRLMAAPQSLTTDEFGERARDNHGEHST